MSTAARTRSLRASAGLVAIAALALTACASDESAEFEDGQAEAAGQTEQSDSASTDDADQADSDGQSDQESPEDGPTAAGEETTEGESSDEEADEENTSPVDQSRHPDNAQQVVTYPLPAVEGEMTMGLQSLTASDQGLLLSASFVPEYDDAGSGALTMHELHEPGGSKGHNAYLLPTLSDRQNFKQYYVPTPDPDDRAQGWTGRSVDAWATNLEGFGLTSGEVFTMWAYFPIPEDDIDVIDVSVMPGAPEFQNVEIDWADVDPGQGSSESSADTSSEDDE